MYEYEGRHNFGNDRKEAIFQYFFMNVSGSYVSNVSIVHSGRVKHPSSLSTSCHYMFVKIILFCLFYQYNTNVMKD